MGPPLEDGGLGDIGPGNGGSVLLGPRTLIVSGNVIEDRRSRRTSAIGMSADIEDDLDGIHSCWEENLGG